MCIRDSYYTNNIDEIEKADIILLPGSKNTLSDLQSLRACGIADAIIRAHKNGKKVIGICGGYQMMGARLEDPKACLLYTSVQKHSCLLP